MSDKAKIDVVVKILNISHSNIYNVEKKGKKFNDMKYLAQSGSRGWAIIKKYIKNFRDGIIVEIGVFAGATPLNIIDILESNNLTYYGIDPWEKCTEINGVQEQDIINHNKNGQKLITNRKINMRSIRQNLEKIIHNYKLEKINLIFDFSSNVVDNFNDKSISVLHIDGSHDAESVYNDLKNYYPKMKEGGIIIGDDCKWESVKKGLKLFVDEFNCKYTIEYTKFIIKV